ncbi:MAG: 3-hydroxyacyl-ACP dehydratase FabZ family protein [Phycisphaerae bacterium]|jgi:3-hydroxyacyl-[acyl-carrier-protein] dehydratase
MNFGLIDRIVELSRGERIVALKAVSRAEEYLADHFPTFPVLPGVLMLEAMAEAGAWLLRDSGDFEDPVVLLKKVRNATYKDFVTPGDVVVYTVTCRRLSKDVSDFEGVGRCGNGGREVVRARFGLTQLSAGDPDGPSEDVNRRLAKTTRAQFARLRK